MTEVLQTERLHLRPISPEEDAAALFEIYRNPQAMRFMPTPPHRNLEETKAELTQSLAYQGAVGWVVCMRKDPRPIGYVNFLGEVSIPGMGYILHPDYWGKGITPEACRTVLAYGFEKLNYDRVELWINQDNAASIRVAQKLGFKLRGKIPQKYNHEKVHHIMLVFGLAVGEDDPGGDFFKGEPVLNVADVEKTAVYYRDMLGFRIDFFYGSPPTHAAVTRGSWTGSGVTIQLSQALAGEAVTPTGSLHIQVGVNLDALYQDYLQRGVTMLHEPATRPWGMRDFSIRDCNGFLLTFATQT